MKKAAGMTIRGSGQEASATGKNSKSQRGSVALVRICLERGEGEGAVDFLALGPVVVGVAFKTAGLGVIGTGGVAGFAVGDAGDEDVGSLSAGEGLFVAAEAVEAAVGVVIEFGVREPFLRCPCRGNFGQR